MENMIVFVWFGLIASGLVWGLVIAPRLGKTRIVDWLQKRGASEISVAFVWWGSRNGYYSYDVAFRDAQGKVHQTRCLAHFGLLSSEQIYWASAAKEYELQPQRHQ